MTERPDVVKKLSMVLRNTWPGAKVTVGSTAVTMVTPDHDTFTIQVQHTRQAPTR